MPSARNMERARRLYRDAEAIPVAVHEEDSEVAREINIMTAIAEALDAVESRIPPPVTEVPEAPTDAASLRNRMRASKLFHDAMAEPVLGPDDVHPDLVREKRVVDAFAHALDDAGPGIWAVTPSCAVDMLREGNGTLQSLVEWHASLCESPTATDVLRNDVRSMIRSTVATLGNILSQCASSLGAEDT